VVRKTNSKSRSGRNYVDLVSGSLDQIATILLRIGFDAPAAEQLLRHAFIAAASRAGIAGSHRPTQSQIASLAGVTRLEVRKVIAGLGKATKQISDSNSRIAHLIGGWRNDPKYSRRGNPLGLQYRGPRSEFEALVRDYGRDVTSKTLRTQLVMLGLAKERDGKLYVVKGSRSTFQMSAASADLKFVASQLAKFNFEFGQREYLTRRISISAAERKAAEAVRQIAQGRLQAVLSSLESMSDKAQKGTKSRFLGRHRVIVSTTVAVESEESV
jgi:hypothetical protein